MFPGYKFDCSFYLWSVEFSELHVLEGSVITINPTAVSTKVPTFLHFIKICLIISLHVWFSFSVLSESLLANSLRS